MSTVTNWGTAIFASLAAALTLVLSFLPKLVGFLVILIIGWIVAALLEKGITLLLRRVGFDRMSERMGLTRFEQRMNIRMDPAKVLGKVVFWFVFLIFLVPACNALELNSVSSLLGLIISYIPNVFVAIVVLFLGMLLATFVADIVRGAATGSKTTSPNILSNIARYTIIGFAILVALEQLNIAPALITILFTSVVGGAALACALAFGLGGRDSARQLLEHSIGTVGNMAPAGMSSDAASASQLDMRQRMNQSPQMGAKPVNTSTTASGMAEQMSSETQMPKRDMPDRDMPKRGYTP